MRRLHITVLLAAAAAAVAAPTAALVAPNTSLATIPVAYFGGKGGKSGARSPANLAMLSKMRIVMLEKWEGGCWDNCLANATAGLPCSRCNVEEDMLGTLTAVRSLNPAVTTVMYLNALLMFPFYELAGKYIAADALLKGVDGNPVELKNDDGMRGVFVPDFGTQAGRDLWMAEVTGWLGTGLVDGIFADKWPDQAHVNQSDPGGSWTICNKVCAAISPDAGAAFNAGKLQLRANLSALFKVDENTGFAGLLYGDGCDGCYRKGPPRIDGNLVGPWIKNWQNPAPHPTVTGQNVINTVLLVRSLLHTYHYAHVYVGCGDHHPSENKPVPPCEQDLCTDCTPDGIAIFLLLVEEGVFLGANGWDPAFDRPLGEPKGPASNVTGAGGEVVGLERSFASGTVVYYNLTNNSATIDWAA